MSFDETIEKLKTLKEVEPDEQFVENTRRVIFASGSEAEKSIGFSLVPRWGYALGAVLILMVVSGFLFLSPSDPAVADSLNSSDLEQELNSLTIQIEDIDYDQNTNQTIASALNEISTTKGSHLNKSILENEQKAINALESENDSGQINEKLNRVIF